MSSCRASVFGLVFGASGPSGNRSGISWGNFGDVRDLSEAMSKNMQDCVKTYPDEFFPGKFSEISKIISGDASGRTNGAKSVSQTYATKHE